MSGINTNRTTISVPAEVSQDILQKTQGASAIMTLAKQITLPGRGVQIPVITSDPSAAWVAETGAKPVSNPGLSSKLMQAYKMAVIVPFSEEFLRDMRTLYDTLVARLPGALANMFDKTVIGTEEAPGENFDSFALCTAQTLIASGSATLYDGLVAAYGDIAAHGGSLDGFAMSPAGIGLVLGATDSTGRPIFVNGVTEGDVSRLLGRIVKEGRGCYKAGVAPVGSGDGSPAIVGVAGDWTQAMFGIVEGIKIDYSREATLNINSTQINLWEHNMVAVRAEIEVGFRADTNCFNLLTGATPSA